MAILLSDLKVGMADKVQAGVIDTFIRESAILARLPFDDAVSPSSGSTMTYGYVQTKIPGQTGFRALNTEYTPSEATVEKKTVDLKILGGAFQIDRVIKAAEGLWDNMEYQITEKVKSAIGTFHNGLINGSSVSDALSFDGLSVMLTGTTSEYNAAVVIDISTAALLETNASAFYEALMKMVRKTGANAIFVNSDMAAKIETVARVLGYKTLSEDAFGRTITSLSNGVEIVDLGKRYTVADDVVTGKDIIDTVTRTVATVETTGLTDIFCAKYGVMDGLCGVTLTGNNAIETYLPDFTTPGAVKEGEVELVAACALKKTQSAGVLRNIKIS